MPDTSPILALPYILPAQAQKHVTHNEALRLLDAIVQLVVIAADRTEPPASPVPGDRYVVAPDATGAWAGQDGCIAVADPAGWLFYPPQAGWRAEDLTRGGQIRFDGTVWNDVAVIGETVEQLGIATSPDSTNRLAVASPATLLTHAGTDHRLVVNKALPADTASLLFQTGWSGRAEMGLTGDDDFAVKVSPDGTAWHDALRVERTTGRVVVTGQRERLTAPRTYYVRKDGNDGNDGLDDSAEGAFLTIKRATDQVFGGIDLGPHDVTIQLGDGVYEEIVVLNAPALGSGSVTLRGNAGHPENTVIRMTSDADLSIAPGGIPGGVLHIWGASLRIADLAIQRESGPVATCIDVRQTGVVIAERDSTVLLGPGSTAAIRVIGGEVDLQGAHIAFTGSPNGLARIIQCSNNGGVNLAGTTIDVDGRHFSGAMFDAQRGGVISNTGDTTFLTGTATGNRVSVNSNGVIHFGSRPLSSLPGSADGSIATGGVYVPVP